MTDVHRLALPPADVEDWRTQGACQDIYSDVSFHPDGEAARAAARVPQAWAVCRGCPELLQCCAPAFAIPEPYGVWVGLMGAGRCEQARSDAQNVVIRVDFTRGRPHGPHVPTPDSWPAA